MRMTPSETVGQRIARIRVKRKYSQTTLANLAVTTRDTIASIELGRIATPSSSMLGAIANALDVDVERLLGVHEDDPEMVHDLLPTILRALAATDLVIDGVEPRPLDDIRVDILRLGEWRRATKYSKIGTVLPDLIDELLIAASELGEPAYALLTSAYRAANTIGHKYGYAAVRLTAVERMLWAAEQSGDQLLIAMTHYLRAAALARIGATRQAMMLLNRTIDEVQPIAEPGNSIAAAVYSALHMKAGTIAASMTQREASEAHLAEAALFAGTRDRIVHETVVGPTNVKLHQLAAAVDLGELGKAAEVVDGLELPTGYAKERIAYGLADTARMHLGKGEVDLAVDVLYEASEVAPEHFRSASIQMTVKETRARQRRQVRGIGELEIRAGIKDL